MEWDLHNMIISQLIILDDTQHRIHSDGSLSLSLYEINLILLIFGPFGELHPSHLVRDIHPLLEGTGVLDTNHHHPHLSQSTSEYILLS